jgi:transcriptional regulator with XRE-family HTH domain
MNIKEAFGLALKKTRNSEKLTQEDFSEVSSRTYISSLERGKKSITIEKLDQISKSLNIHPITLLSLTYLNYDKNLNVENLVSHIHQQLKKLSNH